MKPWYSSKLGNLQSCPGGAELIAKLRDTALSQNASAKAGMDDMELLFKYLEVFGVDKKVPDFLISH